MIDYALGIYLKIQNFKGAFKGRLIKREMHKFRKQR